MLENRNPVKICKMTSLEFLEMNEVPTKSQSNLKP